MYKKKNSMVQLYSLDDVCLLIKQNYQTDELGQDIPIEEEREVFCAILPIYSTEYTKLHLQGIKPRIAFVMQKEEYGGETLIAYQGQRYTVYRLYPVGEMLELYCEVRKGGN